MDSLVMNGDHAVDARGIPVSVTGTEEMMQRALFRLGIRRGSFAYDRELGSELHRLCGPVTAATRRAAHSYAQEALLPIPELSVESVDCVPTGKDAMRVTVELGYEGQSYLLEL